MEEILASIRRIIADDQDAPKPSPANGFAAPSGTTGDPEADLAPMEEPNPDPHPAAADLDIDIPDLDFTEVTPALVPPPPVLSRAPDPESAAERPLPRSAPEPAPDPAPAQPPEPAQDAPDLRLSTDTMAAVGQAFHTLSHTILSRNARTLEDLVKEMLAPMLKAWLDDNLPTVVERLVRAEIERVARGR